MATFTKQDRILKSLEFKTTLNWGTKAVTPNFVLFAKPKKTTDRSRLGLIVSKKVGNAVVRNKVKRRLREIFRGERPSISMDLVVIARHTASSANHQLLLDEYRKGLKRMSSRLTQSKNAKETGS